MNNALAKNHNAFTLFKFALPSIIMMVFFSFYTIIDGLFVSNFVNTTALSAINIVYPVLSLGTGLSIMIASGGSALIARKLGEHNDKEARCLFTFLIVMEVVLALILCLIGNIFINPIVRALGATDSQFEMAKDYLRIWLFFAPFAFLQSAFQIFFVTAGKPKLGLVVIIIAGIMNILLDYLFIHLLNLGISGASLGTGIACLVPSFTGLLYFFFNKKGQLYLSKFKIMLPALKTSCINGSSEMMTNLATSITTIIFNYQCLKFYGEDGVAAITIVLYFQFLLSAIFFGFSQGTAPIISYQFGNRNKIQLKKIYKYCLITVLVLSITSFGMSFALINPVTILFAGYKSNVYNIVMNNFVWYSFSLLFMGLSIFASSYFTALGDGLTSSIISFLRTLVFLAASLLIIPLIMGEAGVWFSVTVAELLGLIVAIFFLRFKNLNKIINTNIKKI